MLIPAAVWVLLLLGCASFGLVDPAPARTTALPTRTLAPTFTPTPEDLQALLIVTPPTENEPGVIVLPAGVQPQIVLPPPPTDTPSVTPTPTVPTATPTATDTHTPTPTSTPTPFIEVRSGLISLRSGPGVNFPLVAQLGPGIPVAITGRNTEGNWWRICCVNGESVWVADRHVAVFNDTDLVELVSAGPAPTPTFTATPTETPTPTPFLFPFERAIGPQFFPTNNEFLTIWVYLFVGPLNAEEPAAGYFLEVEFEGFDRPNTNLELPSGDAIEFSAPPGAGNRVKYNYKYEYTPFNPPRASFPGATPTPTALQLLGSGDWTIWVKDGAGNQLSDKVTFRTDTFNPNREVYVAWQRVR